MPGEFGDASLIKHLVDTPFKRHGDNRPPEGADPLTERLAEDYREITDLAARLLEAEARIPASLTEETLGRCADFGRQLKALIKKAEASRKLEKDPFLEAGRKVDGWFGEITSRLAAVVGRVEDRVGAYLKAKEAEERRRREAEARALEKEARELAKEGEHQLAQETRADARELKAEARTAHPADLVRTHTGLGGVATLTAPIEHEVTDKAAAVAALWREIDDEALDKAIRSYKRAGGAKLRDALATKPKDQPIPGVTLFISRKASIR